MNFVVVQTQKYEGDNWWNWSLFIQGSNEDLDQIEAVTYRLHPTFPKPIRTTTNRASKFQLQCAGWGVFTIPIEVRLKNGDTIELEHDLQFTFPDERGDS
ncbi:MAG TPA: pYEATS domain-containing protein [Chthoniobacteraceae bacterium]